MPSQLIQNYIDRQKEPKRSEMLILHNRILQLKPDCKLWFEDGKNAEGKVISNPNIGYGSYIINYANGTTKEFFKIGMSANTTGISIYILGKDDKTYLANTLGNSLGKASISGYCIKFKSIKDINLEILDEAVKYGFGD